MKLICPICGKPLVKQKRSALCEQRHCFDYAKSGYLNLLRSSGGDHGDNAAMVQARTAFLNTGAYAFLRETAGLMQKRWKQEILFLLLLVAFFGMLTLVLQ